MLFKLSSNASALACCSGVNTLLCRAETVTGIEISNSTASIFGEGVASAGIFCPVAIPFVGLADGAAANASAELGCIPVGAVALTDAGVATGIFSVTRSKN